MRKLIEFLISKKHWFLFLLLEVLSIVVLYRNNAYQRNIMLSSANVLTAEFSSIAGFVKSYMDLRDANKQLLERNGQLEMEMLDLQDELEMLKADTATFSGFVVDSLSSSKEFSYDFVIASVVNNSVNRLLNYITIDKGREDGIAPDMGVVSEKGVVGVVSNVSDHFAVVIPLLNPKSRLSCKIVGSSHFGTLAWDKSNPKYASLSDLPKHVEFELGDLVVTSGYSAIFPSGIIVGTVVDYKKLHDDNFYSLKIQLATDFKALKNVRVIKNFSQEERLLLEKEAKRND